MIHRQGQLHHLSHGNRQRIAKGPYLRQNPPNRQGSSFRRIDNRRKRPHPKHTQIGNRKRCPCSTSQPALLGGLHGADSLFCQSLQSLFLCICKHRHHVLGNHCVYTLKKQEFLETVGQKKSYYSFDSGQFHFIVLDSCFRSDGQPYGRKNFEWTDPNIPRAEVDWLRADLKATSKKTVVFAHQRLDVSSVYGVKNAPAVRKVMEDSGQVLAVFQGHSHENDHKEIGGVHYCTLVAMIEGSGAENNGYSLMSLADDGTIRLNGFRKQGQYQWQG